MMNPGGEIKFITTTLRSSLCDYIDAYILVKGNITIIGSGTNAVTKQANKRNKQVTFKNCALLTNYIDKLNNTKVDNADGLDVLIPMYNLIEYRHNYAKNRTFMTVLQRLF